jgi:hypothetical protein
VSIHPTITTERVLEAAQREAMTLDNPGLCLVCGEEMEGCEPDARRYECEAYGSHEVYGAQELLISGMHHK